MPHIPYEARPVPGALAPTLAPSSEMPAPPEEFIPIPEAPKAAARPSKPRLRTFMGKPLKLIDTISVYKYDPNKREGDDERC